MLPDRPSTVARYLLTRLAIRLPHQADVGTCGPATRISYHSGLDDEASRQVLLGSALVGFLERLLALFPQMGAKGRSQGYVYPVTRI